MAPSSCSNHINSFKLFRYRKTRNVIILFTTRTKLFCLNDALWIFSTLQKKSNIIIAMLNLNGLFSSILKNTINDIIITIASYHLFIANENHSSLYIYIFKAQLIYLFHSKYKKKTKKRNKRRQHRKTRKKNKQLI